MHNKQYKINRGANKYQFCFALEKGEEMLRVICKVCNKIILNENSAPVVVETKGRQIGKDPKGNPKYDEKTIKDTIRYVCVDHIKEEN